MAWTSDESAYLKWIEMNLRDSTTIAQDVAKIAEMAWVVGSPSLTGYPQGTKISNAQTGNGASTDVFDMGEDGVAGGNVRQGALVRIVTTVTTTPTCTYEIEGSVDNSTFAALEFSDSGTPTTFSSGTFTTTTATTKVKFIKPGQIWRYIRVVYSSNTNVTNTTDVLALGD